MGVELVVKVRILLLSVHQVILLVVYLLAKGADHVDIHFHTGSVVVFHSAFLVCRPIERLLEIEKLILKILVFSFTSSKVYGLLSELGHKAVLLVLAYGLIVNLSYWAS